MASYIRTALLNNNFLKKVFNSKNDILKLGRWAKSENPTTEHFKTVYSAADHCGDHICGNPSKIKEIANKSKPTQFMTEIQAMPLTQKSEMSTLSKSRISSMNNYSNDADMCCMLLGMNGPCEVCQLMKPLHSQKLNIDKYQ